MENKNFKDILLKIYNNDFSKYEVSNYIKNSSIEELFLYLDANIWISNQTIHIYLVFLEEIIALNKDFPIWFEKYLNYILKNVEKIAEDNIYINKFLLYSYDNFLKSKYVLKYLSTLEISDINELLIVRLIKLYIYEYNKIIILKKYNDFFKNLLNYILDKNILLLKNIYCLDIYKLIFEFKYSLSESIIVLNKLEDNWVDSHYYSSIDSLLIWKLWEKVFIEEISKLPQITLIKFICKTIRNINYLWLADFSNLKDEVVFILSLIKNEVYFKSSKTEKFLDYYFNLLKINNVFDSTLTNVLSIESFFKLIQWSNIDIFCYEKFLKTILETIFSDKYFTYSFKKYIENNIEFLSKNMVKILTSLDNVKIQSIDNYSDFMELFLTVNFRNSDLRLFIQFLNYIDLSKINNLYVSKFVNNLFLNRTIKKLKYKETEELFLFVLILFTKSSFLSWIDNFIFNFCNLSLKNKYIAWKHRKWIRNMISNYDYKKFLNKVYMARVFPFILMHYIFYLLNF